MSEFNTGLPSVRFLQTSIKNKKEVEVKLLTNDVIVGKIVWQDPDCLYIVDQFNQPNLVWRQALVYLKPKA